MKITRPIVSSLTSIALVLPSVAMAETRTAIEKPNMERIYIMQNSDSLAAYKTAYVGAQMIKAEEEAKWNPQIKNDPAAIRTYVMNAQAMAQRQADGVSFRGGLTETVLKGGVDIGSAGIGAAGPVFAPVTVPATKIGGDAIVEATLDHLSVKPADTSMYPEVANYIREKMAGAARDSKNPLHDLYQKEFVRNEKSDPVRFNETSPAFQRDRYEKQTLLELAKHDQGLTDLIKSSKTQGEFEKQFAQYTAEKMETLNGLTEEANESLTNIEKTMNQQAEEKAQIEETRRKRENLTNSFGAASGIATLIGQQEAAEKLNKAGQLAGAIFDIAQGTAGKLLENPAAYLNTTVLAMNLVSAILSGPQDNGMGKLMEAIAALRKQIADLQKKMLEEFAKLNIKIDGYFIESYRKLVATNGSVDINGALLQNILRQMSELRTEMRDGLQENILLHMDATLTPCLTVDPVTKRPLALSQTKFQTCRNVIGTLAAGQTDLPIPAEVRHNAKPEYLTEASGLVNYLFGKAKETSPEDDFKFSMTIHPGNWYWATDSLLRLSVLHPEFVASIKDDSINPDGSLKNIIEQGQALRWFKYYALVDKQEHLRTSLFESILNDYETSINAGLTQAQAGIDKYTTGGVRPGMKFQNDKFAPRETDSIFNIKMPLCGAPGDVGVRFDPVQRRQAVRGFIAPGDRVRPETPALFLNFPKDGLPMKKEWRKFFPDDVLLTARAHSGSQDPHPVKLYGCFEKFETTKLYGEGNHDVCEIAFHIRLGVNEPDADGNPHVTFLREVSATVSAQLSGADGQFDPGDTPLPMAFGMFSGEPIGGNGERVPGWNSNLEGAQVSEIADVAGYKRFQEHYGYIQDQLNDQAQKTIVDGTSGMVQRTKQLKAALLYLLELGQGDNELLMRFHAWVSDPSHLPPASDYADLLFHHTLSRDELDQKVKADVAKAKEFVSQLSQTPIHRADMTELNTRLENLQALDNKASALISGGVKKERNWLDWKAWFGK